MQYRKLTDLKKLENNPRIIRDKQFKTLCDSIRDNPKYFEARPVILSDRTGSLVIIAGNQRYEAAKSLKLKEVPTFLIEGLTEEKEKEIVIRDNISNGEFDWDILANEGWDSLPLADWGVPLPEDWLAPPIDVLDGTGNMSGSNYGDARGDKIPLNILGIGGMIDRELMESVKKKLCDNGADEKADNADQLSDIFLTWVNR